MVLMHEGCQRNDLTTNCELVEILNFRHFFKHRSFSKTDQLGYRKRAEPYLRVSIAINLNAKATKTDEKLVSDK
jgi:hypothetical protein